MATELLDRALPVATLLLGLGLTRLDRKWDRRRDALDEASVLLTELDESRGKARPKPCGGPMQAHLTALMIALRRAGAPDALVNAVRR